MVRILREQGGMRDPVDDTPDDGLRQLRIRQVPGLAAGHPLDHEAARAGPHLRRAVGFEMAEPVEPMEGEAERLSGQRHVERRAARREKAAATEHDLSGKKVPGDGRIGEVQMRRHVEKA